MSKITVADIIKALQFGYEQRVNTTLTPKDIGKLLDEIVRLRNVEVEREIARARLAEAEADAERLFSALVGLEALQTHCPVCGHVEHEQGCEIVAVLAAHKARKEGKL